MINQLELYPLWISRPPDVDGGELRAFFICVFAQVDSLVTIGGRAFRQRPSTAPSRPSLRVVRACEAGQIPHGPETEPGLDRPGPAIAS